MRDKVIIYDQTFTPAVGNVIAASAFFDMATVNAGEHTFIIEEMYIWSPYFGAVPEDLDRVEILLDGAPYPMTPSRLQIRATAERCMATPYDPRFAMGPFPFGKVSLDPLEDTTVKITPAQTLAVRLWAGATTGVRAAASAIRVMMRGRIADTDAQLQNIYGGSMYQPDGPTRLGDPVTGKISPVIAKTFPITIDNARKMSGATAQNPPVITPFWTFGVNSVVIPAAPEYEWTYVNPAHVANPWEDMSFDWTRIKNRLLHLKDVAAYLAAGSGRVFLHQPPLRRPGHLNLFFGWPITAPAPILIPGGGGPAMTGTGMFKGPYELDPKVLAYNNLTQLRVVADPGTTIVAGDLEMQIRGTHIEY